MDLYFSDKRQTFNNQIKICSNRNNTIINDHYYLIYGVKVSNELYHTIIDYIIESGEWEGEIMEFIEEDDWNFFETEGRSKPDRYEWLEGFPEYFFGFKSIMNARGEDILYVGDIIWTSKNINMVDKCIPEIPIINSLTEEAIKKIHDDCEEIKYKLKKVNQYWSDNFDQINYYWIKGSD